MNKEKKNYVIIGNGIAGISAAEEIRKRDEEGSITIVTAEDYLTYYRVKLSHFISKEFENEELIMKNLQWHQEKRIDVRLGKIVEKIDPDKQRIQIDDGSEIYYNQLLLTMGSRPFIPPVTGKYKEGVFALRTLRDLRYIKKYFSICKSVTVVGGGLLGLEAAWAIKELGKEVNVVEFFPYLCPRQLDQDLSEIFAKKLKEKGLNIYLNTQAEEILGKTEVEGIQFKEDKSIETDAVLFSAGIRPNLDLVRETSIAFNKGIKVDAYMKTNLDNIYAAGDVAEVDGVVMGLWNAASEQGKVAGANMAGQEKAYQLPEPYTILNIAGISIFSAGNIKDYDQVKAYNDEAKDAYYKLFITKGKITGGILMGDVTKMVKVKKAVSDNTDISELLSQDLNCKEVINKL